MKQTVALYGAGGGVVFTGDFDPVTGSLDTASITASADGRVVTLPNSASANVGESIRISPAVGWLTGFDIWIEDASGEMCDSGEDIAVGHGSPSYLPNQTVGWVQANLRQAYGDLLAHGHLQAAAPPPQAAAAPAQPQAAAPNGSGGIILASGRPFVERMLDQGGGIPPETDVQHLRRLIALTEAEPWSPQHSMLWGGAGTGKTSLHEAVVGHGFPKVSFSGFTEVAQVVAHEQYVPGTNGLLEARVVMAGLLQGFVHKHEPDCPRNGAGICPRNKVLLDEVNAAPPDISTLLHPFLDGSSTVEFEGVVYERGEPDYWCNGTGNHEAGPLSLALKSRLRNAHEVFPSPSAAKGIGVPQELIDFLEKTITNVESGNHMQMPSIRDLQGAASHFRYHPASGWHNLLGCANDERQAEEWLQLMRDMVDASTVAYLERTSGSTHIKG